MFTSTGSSKFMTSLHDLFAFSEMELSFVVWTTLICIIKHHTYCVSFVISDYEIDLIGCEIYHKHFWIVVE